MHPADEPKPLIVQSDLTVLIDATSPLFDECRDAIAQFSELIKSPEYIHTYRITPISLWNAAALGMDAGGVTAALERYSRFPIPGTVRHEIAFNISRFGKLTLYSDGKFLRLNSPDRFVIMEIYGSGAASPFIDSRTGPNDLRIRPEFRGELKRALLRLGYPVRDEAGYSEGSALSISLRRLDGAGRRFELRDYQKAAVEAFGKYGSGVVSLPCGAGKTCIGIAAIELVGSETLVLTTNTVAVRQWIEELVSRTTIARDDVGEYTGDRKQIRPVTVSTYQTIMWRRGGQDNFPHFKLLTDRDWGLVIYDEVHLLPAPIFRVTAQIQAKRRLGLTATLVREDHLEGDVFSLVGPKRYELPWKNLENAGFIARANCYEIRVGMGDSVKYDYAVSKQSLKHRVCAVNPAKIEVIKKVLSMHPGEPALIIGQYLDQLRAVAGTLGAPLITGSVPSRDREKLYSDFKKGLVPVLVVSKVANFAIDLPDASCAIQISGAFGSRQEEAQRLGRILRPKADGREAHFYSVVSTDSVELEFSQNRQLFLTEQGYRYYILDAAEFLERLFLPGETSGGKNILLNGPICDKI